MFYFKEITLQIKYFFFTFFLIILIIFWQKQNFFILFCFSVIKYYPFISFFYTHPFELFKIYFVLVLLVSAFFITPFLTILLSNFLLSSLFVTQSKFLQFFFNMILLLLFFYNALLLFIFLPNLWLLFEKINVFFIKPLSTLTFLELKLDQYFDFVLWYVLVFNFFFILTSLFCGLMFLLINFKILKYKFVFYIFLIFCLISFAPIDFLFLIIVLSYIIIFIESFFIFIFYSKNKKIYQLF